MHIILYHAKQYHLGGIETFNYNFCRVLSEYYDITFLCDEIEPAVYEKLDKYVDVEIVENGKIYTCDLCIFSSAWGKRPEKQIKAKKYVQMVHADYTQIQEHWNFKYLKLGKVTEHWGGGEAICKSFYEYTKGEYGECKKIHYLLDPDVKTERVLRLISTTRIGKEKGFHRMLALATELKNRDIKFLWDIWGDGFDDSFVRSTIDKFANIKEVCFRGFGTNLASYVGDADYLVQLSDTEGYCFAIYEALSMNVPVIATDFPNAREQINDGENGYILPLDVTNYSKYVDKIYKKIPKFKFEPIATAGEWIKLIGKPGKKAKKRSRQIGLVVVKCIKPYHDMELGRRVAYGEVLKLLKPRASNLNGLGLVRILTN